LRREWCHTFHFWHTGINHIDENISARATFLVEQHALANSMQLADALIAATALEHGLDLLTANAKHYRSVDGLAVQIFRPG
jgi:predicted nucleic acid-binding protein